MRYLITFVLVLLSYCSYGQIVGTQVLAFKGNITSTIRDGLDVPTGEFWLIYNSTTSQLEQSGDDDVWTEFSAGAVAAGDVSIVDAGAYYTGTEVEAMGQEIGASLALKAATTDFDTSSELAGILGDETGTGNVMFSASPTTTGTLITDAIRPSVDGSVLTLNIGTSSLAYNTVHALGYIFKSNVAADINWYLKPLTDDDLEFRREVTPGSNNYTNVDYKLNGSGTPADANDLVDIGFLQAGLDDLASVIDASAFSGNLATTDDTLQEIADKVDGLSTGGADNLGNHTATTALDMVQNPINNILSAEWVYTTGANEVTTGFSAGNAVFHLAAPNDASQALRYNFTTGDWFIPYDNTTSGLTADDLWEAVDELAAGAGDTSLSNTNQTVPTGTTRTVNAAGTATIGFQQDGVEVARVGGDNNDVFQVLALEALTGNVIASNSGIGLAEIDTGASAASLYSGSLVKDTGVVYFSNGTIWIELGLGSGIEGTISGRAGTAMTAAQFETAAQIASNGTPNTGELVVCSDCSPAEVVTTATIAMDGWKMYDDQTADAATITLSDCDPGETLTVYINRASAPTLAGTGLTFNQLPNTTAFAGATEMAIYFEVSYNGTTIDYYYFER